MPVLAGADGEIYGLGIRPSAGIILAMLVDKTHNGKGYVMRYIHILDVSDKIVEAAGKKAGFTLADWKADNISGDLNISNLGVKVKQGEVIGLSGGQRRLRAFGSTDTSGPHSGGAHLHLELLEFEEKDFNKDKIRSCVSCGKQHFTHATPTPKAYTAYLADGVDVKNSQKQKAQDPDSES